MTLAIPYLAYSVASAALHLPLLRRLVKLRKRLAHVRRFS